MWKIILPILLLLIFSGCEHKFETGEKVKIKLNGKSAIVRSVTPGGTYRLRYADNNGVIQEYECSETELEKE